MPLNLYYIDDEQELCENFVDYFASEDVVVTTFVDPKAAIEAANEKPPDLIFVDYRMPGTTGDEVAKMFDERIPKFLITGEVAIKTDFKFVKIFSKPYPEEEILETINSLLKKKAV